MKLFRVQSSIDWCFILAMDEVDARRMFCDGFGLELDDINVMVEYQMDVPQILPEGWQSEPKPKETPLATLDVMEHNSMTQEEFDDLYNDEYREIMDNA